MQSLRRMVRQNQLAARRRIINQLARRIKYVLGVYLRKTTKPQERLRP